MKRFRFPATLILLVAPLIASCGPYLPLEGVVIDTSTAKPIPDAFVISEWTTHGGDGVGSRTGCAKVDIVKSDSQGRYRFAGGFTSVLYGDDRSVFAYKAGYQRDGSKPFDDKLVSMKPFKGTGDERAQLLSGFGSLKTCGPSDDIVRILTPLYGALDEESATLVVTPHPIFRPGGFMFSLRRHERAIETERAFHEERKRKKK
jgi:hypothetical protein